MLGIKWDKKKDKLNIEIPPPFQKITNRNMLQKLGSIYDVLGFISPCTLVAKDGSRKVCFEKIPWDKDLPPRSITRVQGKIKEIEFHLFGDASVIRTSAAAYVIQQTSSKTQRIISSKSRLSMKNTSISTLELIATVMVTNLAENITNSS